MSQPILPYILAHRMLYSPSKKLILYFFHYQTPSMFTRREPLNKKHGKTRNSLEVLTRDMFFEGFNKCQIVFLALYRVMLYAAGMKNYFCRHSLSVILTLSTNISCELYAYPKRVCSRVVTFCTAPLSQKYFHSFVYNCCPH